MDFQKLRYIVSMSRLKSVTRAAQENYVAQSTMSSAISSAEAELGFPLFTRSSHGVVPTAAGEVFVERAERILDEYARAVADARIASEPRPKALTIGFCDLSVGSRMPQILAEYARHCFPETISLHKGSLDSLTGLLIAGKVDIVFSNQFEARRSPDIRYVKVAEARPCVYVPKGHRIAGLSRATLADLEGERLFCASSDTDPSSMSAAARVLKAGGVPYAPGSALGDEETIALSVEAGLGLYPAATWYRNALSERCACVPLDLDIESMLITVMWRNGLWDGHARALAACARRVVASEPL